jgi:hypothetical protein
MVEIWAERGPSPSHSPARFKTYVHVVWSMDERPIGPLTGVISVRYSFVALNLWSRYGQREGQANLILQQGFKTYMLFDPWTRDL